MTLARATLGIVFFCAVAWSLSSYKRRFPWRVFVFAILMQLALAGLILGTAAGQAFFQGLAEFFVRLIGVTEPGARLVFGPLADTEAMDGVFGAGAGYVFAVAGKGLMALLFFAALMAILYHLGIMQVVIWCLARVMSFLLGVSGAESMAMAANIFVGPTEAPLVVRPYLSAMTLSELNALMTGGFATIAGTVLAIYMGLVGPELAPHLLTASVMSAPAAFLMAKVMLPEVEVPVTSGTMPLKIERTAGNVIEAATNGTLDGIKLAINVAGMLIAFMALVNLADWPLGWLGGVLDIDGGLSLSRLFGWAFAPLAWMMGVQGWSDCQLVGSLMGTKMALNEFVAFGEMKLILSEVGGRTTFVHERSAAIVTYALCGFANFGTIGIQLGGLASLAPERKADLSRLALRAMFGGALATWMTATIAGLFL